MEAWSVSIFGVWLEGPFLACRGKYQACLNYLFFSATLTNTLNAHRVVKISHHPGCCKIIVLWCLVCFPADYKYLCFHSRKSMCRVGPCLIFLVLFKCSGLLPYAMRRADQHISCSSERERKREKERERPSTWHSVPVFVQKRKWMHHFTWAHLNIHLGCINASRFVL